MFNDRLDATVCGVFLVMVSIILVDSIRVWAGILLGARSTVTTETPFVPSALAEEV